MPLGHIEVVAQRVTRKMHRSNSQAAPEYLGRDKQLFPLILLRSSDVADRRLVEFTEPPGRAIFADVNLGAGLIRAE